MTVSRVPLFPEPAARELKPAPSELPPSLLGQIARLAGASVVAAEPAFGGLSVSASFALSLSNGRKIFAKGAHPGDTAHGTRGLAQEILVYESLGLMREISPPYLGVVSEGGEDGWMLGLWDWVEHNPARASGKGAVETLRAWQDMAATFAPAETLRAALPAAGEHIYLKLVFGTGGKWQRMLVDPVARTRFLGLFVDGERARAWFDANVPKLAAHQAEARSLDGPEGFVHGDLRLDNFLFGPERTYIIDWPNACWGPLVYDAGFLFSNLEALGFGPAEGFFDLYSKSTGHSSSLQFSPRETCVVFSTLSGYFADQAYRDPPAKMPRLRWMQKSMLLAQLNFLARAGVIESPPPLKGQNQ
jgi:hypothetical protein